MQITKELLDKQIAQLNVQKHNYLQAAEKMREQERAFLDNANAAHGAIQALELLIAKLGQPEETSFIPPAPVTANDVASAEAVTLDVCDELVPAVSAA
jgi:hypothetical protein